MGSPLARRGDLAPQEGLSAVYPGRRFPQFEHVESVTRLPVPQFGQRFMPSVLAANGFSRPACCVARRLPLAMISTARIPMIANPIIASRR